MSAVADWSSERFEVVETLGAGGHGVVYGAHDRARGGRVAVKRLSRVEPRTLLRFKREFRALADIVHPNLVAPLELLCESGAWLFTMPLIDGIEFSTYVRGAAARTGGVSGTRRRLPTTLLTRTIDGSLHVPAAAPAAPSSPPEPLSAADTDRLLTVTEQLVGGLIALHEYGLVHRDLKPSNVLVDTSGRVHVLDFGLVAGHAAAEQGVIGTPAYMAPEQARGAPAGPPADWYALGVMLFECLTGSLPFEGQPLRLLEQKLRVNAPSPRSRIAATPAHLDALVTSLLARDPRARPGGLEILARLREREATDAASPLPLIGRRGELRRLETFFAEAERGNSPTALVTGRSGLGKSHLVAHAVSTLGSRAHFLSGRCREHERVPHAALDEVVDALALTAAPAPSAESPRGMDELVRVFPVLGGLHTARAKPRGSGREARRAAASALRRLLSNLADERVLVIFIDDVQWGDADSARFLLQVLEPGPIPRVAWLFAARSEGSEQSPFLRTLRERDAMSNAERIELTPLAEAEALALVEAAAPQTPAAHADRIIADAAGHPMFLAELSRHRGPPARALRCATRGRRRAKERPRWGAAPTRRAGPVDDVHADGPGDGEFHLLEAKVAALHSAAHAVRITADGAVAYTTPVTDATYTFAAASADILADKFDKARLIRALKVNELGPIRCGLCRSRLR